MEHIKRQRENYHFHNNKKQKLQILTTNDNVQLLTCFEDLSNDLLYEIFDYLDHYDIYQAFYGLNQRFDRLLLESSYPLEIHLSSISKFNFVHYYNRIISPNKHRIRVFCITNTFLAKEIFLLQTIHNKYSQIETLILKNILYEHLISILISIKSYLSKLSSFVLDIIDEIPSPDTIYNDIYSISTLNYCKLTFQFKYNSELTSIDDKRLSSIKYLILNTSFYLHDLDFVLSYLPNLYHLSINYLDGSHSKRKKTHSCSLQSLKKLNLKVQSIKFYQFEQLIIDYFSSIQIFHLSVDNDPTYLNARQWEELITNHLTNLKTFDFHYTSVQRTIEFYNNHELMEEFVSSFWIERQWFFNNQYEQSASYHKDFFYSTNPYRRHDYTFYWRGNEKPYLCDQDTNFDKINYLCISGTQKMNTTEKYFPNVIELTIDTNSIVSQNSIVAILNSTVNLSKITKLVIKRYRFPLKQLIELLSATIHVSSLKVSSLPSNDDTEDKNELFKKVSNLNMVKSFIIDECCTLQKIRLLMKLFPRLEQLITQMNRKEFPTIMTFLLTNTQYLCFICFLNVRKVSLREVKKLIKHTKITDTYEINHTGKKIYLWW